LRTSIIGHEPKNSNSLLNWFLSQKNSVNGYANAIFSGLPTIEIAKILDEFVIPNSHLSGLYHLSADPISKYNLLVLISKVYNFDINIISVPIPRIDRSLDSSRFKSVTGYKSKSWPEMIKNMKEFG
jgi:dTDP-4-dehydrorhamnose reductase